jgi:hypothetical protein
VSLNKNPLELLFRLDPTILLLYNELVHYGYCCFPGAKKYSEKKHTLARDVLLGLKGKNLSFEHRQLLVDILADADHLVTKSGAWLVACG